MVRGHRSSSTDIHVCHKCMSLKYIYICNTVLIYYMAFPGGTVVKNLPANAGDARDASWISGLRRSPGVGNGNLLQYSCLKKNSMDRGVTLKNKQTNKNLAAKAEQ